MNDYRTEIENMKSIIHDRGTWMDNHIADLYQYNHASVSSKVPQNLAAILFILSFVLAVVVARKE